jgi:hypothetical protein
MAVIEGRLSTWVVANEQNLAYSPISDLACDSRWRVHWAGFFAVSGSFSSLGTMESAHC